MKIGFCANPEKIHEYEKYGADFIEANYPGIYKFSEKEFKEVKNMVKASCLPVESANCLFPGSIRVTGASVDYNKIDEYLNFIFTRAAELGIKTTVFGSGGARRIEEGFDTERAYNQLLNAAYFVGETAKKYDITIVMEPLAKCYCNILTSVKDTVKFVKTVSHPNVLALADLHHMGMDNEPIENIINGGKYMYHAHIASGDDRRLIPFSDTDYPYAEFLDALIKNGNITRLAIEADVKNIDDLGRGIKYLKEKVKELENGN